MKLLKLLLLILMSSRPLLAATEFEDSIPIEVFTAFLVNPHWEPPAYYPDMAMDFPLVPPPGFIVRGTFKRYKGLQLILQTTQDIATAEKSLLDNLLAAGWQQVVLSGVDPWGFIRTPTLPTTFELCHSELGMMQFRVIKHDAGSIAHVVYANGMPGDFPTCASMPTSPRSVFKSEDGIDMYLPSLVLPELLDADLGYRLAAGGGGSRDDYRIDVSVNSDWSTAELFAHLATQLSAQGWTSSPELVDETFAVGSWQKTTQDNKSFKGILTIVAKTDTRFDLSFRLLRNDNASGVPSDEQ